MKSALLCDFDGTIVTFDTSEFLLDKFVKEDWRILDTYLERGIITLEECLQKQYILLRASEEQMLRVLEKVFSFRQNFEKLVRYCDRKGIHFIVVSAGLDFVMNHFLSCTALEKSVEIYAAETRFTLNGIKLTFPKFYDRSSLDFKEDFVKHCKKQGFKTFYIGDGLTDFNAVRKADFTFAITNSKLAEFCKKERIPHLEINDFQEVIDAIDN
ncbi:MAG: HAD-IB family phosphatase [Candidatus Bathyarchaeota archaeon]|nr:MAG: HAD-IB family phosphatase [Candidatus Bathyarchaeota archaeon]